jgi:chromosome partitioning protein
MIVAVAGQKGGVGKSTVAVCLADEAACRGLSVLLVDADPQGTARTWGEVAAENAQTFKRPSAYVEPTVVAMGETMHRPDQLPRLAAGFAHVIVDLPPRQGAVQRSALMVADVALLPCGASAADAWALGSSLDMVREAQTIRPDLRAVVCLTRKQGRTTLGQGARDALAAGGLPILAAELGFRIAYQESLAAGVGVTRYAPKDAAAREVRALLDELMRFDNAQAQATSDHAKAAPRSRRR